MNNVQVHTLSCYKFFGRSISLLKYSEQCIKYEKHFPKMYKDVGMAVPKTTQTR